MRKGFLLAVFCCMMHAATAYTQHSIPFTLQTTNISFIVAEPLVHEPVNYMQKKKSLKDRIQVKLFQTILKKKAADEDGKKAVKMLGLFSILASFLGPITLLLAFASASPGIFVALGIAFSLTAVILGLLSLKKRKALADKTGTSTVPAWIGIILGGLFVLAVGSLFAFVRINTSTF